MGVPQNPSQHSASGRLCESIGIIICHANERCIFKGICRFWACPVSFREGTFLQALEVLRNKVETAPKVKGKLQSSPVGSLLEDFILDKVESPMLPKLHTL